MQSFWFCSIAALLRLLQWNKIQDNCIIYINIIIKILINVVYNTFLTKRTAIQFSFWGKIHSPDSSSIACLSFFSPSVYSILICYKTVTSLILYISLSSVESYHSYYIYPHFSPNIFVTNSISKWETFYSSRISFVLPVIIQHLVFTMSTSCSHAHTDICFVLPQKPWVVNCICRDVIPVSYTHLDVYKRQEKEEAC